MVEVELHGTRFEVADVFTGPLVVVDDPASRYRGTYRSDPRSDGRWTGETGRDVINPTMKEDLEIVLAAAREQAGPTFFETGKRYLLVLKGGEAILGECVGPYSAPSPSTLIRTRDGEVAVMFRTIRSAIADDGTGILTKDKALEAVRVRFSCGHSGGVWPEAANPGTTHQCLDCGRSVTVVAAARSVGS